MSGVSLFIRDDIVLIPIHDLLPMPLGLIWCTAQESDRIRAFVSAADHLPDPDADGAPS
jgi:hypothetical protein